MVATAPNASDCEAYFKFEDLTDSTANGRNLTNDGATSGATGKIDNGYSFDGDNDHMTMTATGWSDTTSWSVSGWVNIISYGTGGANDRSYWFDFVGSSGAIRFLVATDHAGQLAVYDGAWHDFGTKLSLGWHHLVVTTDSGSIKMYVDGSQYGSTATGTSRNLGTELNVDKVLAEGEALGNFDNLNAVYDEMSIFKVVLTADNVTYLHNNGSPTTAQQYPFSTGAELAKINGISLTTP